MPPAWTCNFNGQQGFPQDPINSAWRLRKGIPWVPESWSVCLRSQCVEGRAPLPGSRGDIGPDDGCPFQCRQVIPHTVPGGVDATADFCHLAGAVACQIIEDQTPDRAAAGKAAKRCPGSKFRGHASSPQRTEAERPKSLPMPADFAATSAARIHMVDLFFMLNPLVSRDGAGSGTVLVIECRCCCGPAGNVGTSMCPGSRDRTGGRVGPRPPGSLAELARLGGGWGLLAGFTC